MIFIFLNVSFVLFIRRKGEWQKLSFMTTEHKQTEKQMHTLIQTNYDETFAKTKWVL